LLKAAWADTLRNSGSRLGWTITFAYLFQLVFEFGQEMEQNELLDLLKI
jgi:hypothetical protein